MLSVESVLPCQACCTLQLLQEEVPTCSKGADLVLLRPDLRSGVARGQRLDEFGHFLVDAARFPASRARYV